MPVLPKSRCADRMTALGANAGQSCRQEVRNKGHCQGDIAAACQIGGKLI